MTARDADQPQGDALSDLHGGFQKVDALLAGAHALLLAVMDTEGDAFDARVLLEFARHELAEAVDREEGRRLATGVA